MYYIIQKKQNNNNNVYGPHSDTKFLCSAIIL